MIRKSEHYTDLKGVRVPINHMDAVERKLLARLRRRAKSHPDWNDFENYWTRALADFYEARGMSRGEIRRTPIYRIAQDLGSRIAIDAGLARPTDYRDELETLIRERFKTRRAFCDATGISEDMLSHVLARRKHLAIDTLMHALARIGCTLRITTLDTK